MAIIVIFHEASGKKKIRMASYRISWNQADHQKSTERTEQGLFTSEGLIQKIYEMDPLTCPKCQEKKVLFFLSEFPYLVVPPLL